MKFSFLVLLLLIIGPHLALAGAKKASEGHPGVYDDIPGQSSTGDKVFDPYRGYQSILGDDDAEDAPVEQQSKAVSWLAIMRLGGCDTHWYCYSSALGVANAAGHSTAGTTLNACSKPSAFGDKVSCAKTWIDNSARTVYIEAKHALLMISAMCSKPSAFTDKVYCLHESEKAISGLHPELSGLFDACDSSYYCLQQVLAELKDDL